MVRHSSIKVITLMLVVGPEAPNAQNICIVLNEGLKARFNRDLDSLATTFTFVTDGASVMANVAGSSVSQRLASASQNWMPCLAHQFDTAMKVTMARISRTPDETFKKIWDDFQVVKKIVTHAKQSGWNSRHPVQYRLIQEVPSRFSTWLSVVERFMKSAGKVREIARSLHSTVPSDACATLLTERDMDGIIVCFPALHAIVDAFDILAEAQKSFEGAKHPTIHLALPSFQNCLDELDRVAGGGNVWRGELRGRVPPSTYSRRLCAFVRELLCEKAKVHDLWLVGCFLHPFLREYQFIPDTDLRTSYRARAETLTRVLYRGVLSRDGATESAAPQVPEEENFSLCSEAIGVMRNTGKRAFSLLQYADSHFHSKDSTDEVSRYNTLDIASLNLDKVSFMKDHSSSMRFWYTQKMTFPALYKVALRVFATPVSSCASERVFSALSLMVPSGRSSMTPETLDNIMVLRTWSQWSQ